jgi:hypothetical protein
MILLESFEFYPGGVFPPGTFYWPEVEADLERTEADFASMIFFESLWFSSLIMWHSVFVSAANETFIIKRAVNEKINNFI